MSSHASLLPARAPHAAFGKLLQAEAKYAWRAPLGLLLGVVVPALVLVVLGLIPGADKPITSLGGLTVFSVYFPALIGLALAVISLLSLPVHLPRAGHPAAHVIHADPPAWMLGAQVIVNLVLAVVALGILVVAGTVAFGLGAPKEPAGFALALVLAIAAMFAIGLWISAVTRSAGAAGAIGQLLFFPLLFFSGLYVPRRSCHLSC